MKNEKRKLISRIAGVVLGGVIGLTAFSGLSVGAEEVKINKSRIAYPYQKTKKRQSNITEQELVNVIIKKIVVVLKSPK